MTKKKHTDGQKEEGKRKREEKKKNVKGTENLAIKYKRENKHTSNSTTQFTQHKIIWSDSANEPLQP